MQTIKGYNKLETKKLWKDNPETNLLPWYIWFYAVVCGEQHQHFNNSKSENAQ